MFKMNYDALTDTLYISKEGTINVKTYLDDNFIIVRKTEEGKIKGITITNFYERIKNNELTIENIVEYLLK